MSYQSRPRHCARCATRLALDNADRFCAACRSKANDVLLHPPALLREFWLHDPMRDALDSWHFGKVFTAYRSHPYHGRILSQELVAGWLNLTQAQLSRIENGRAPEELSKLTHWANVLGVPSDLLWFKLPSDRLPKKQPRTAAMPGHAQRTSRSIRSGVVRMPPSAGEPAMADVNRRTLLSSGLAAMSLPALGLSDLRHIVAALDDARRYLDHEVVEYFQQQITNCASDDGARGPRETLPMVLGVIGAIEHHVRSVKPDVRRRLVAVQGPGVFRDCPV
jgi:transcriptional regulator with XRE-family HTH domain